MSNTTPSYSIDLYALFNQEGPAQEEQPQTGLMPRPTGQQATPDAEQEGYSPYGFLPTMAELINAEYPDGLSSSTRPTWDRFSSQQEVLDSYLTPLQEELQTQPIGDTESIRPQMRDSELAPMESSHPVMNPDRDTKEVEPETAQVSGTSSGLLDFIGKGEGGYDSANRGTISGDIIGSQMVAERNGKRVSSMTIGEIRELQSITDPNNPDRLFAVGKYQTIPDTLATAVKGLGLSDDTVFTPEVQEQVGLYLVSEKRPQVGRFIRGEEGASEDDAMLALAREFASIPVPRAIKKGEFGNWPKRDLSAGDSFYADPSAPRGNKPQHTVEETRAVLQQARQK